MNWKSEADKNNFENFILSDKYLRENRGKWSERNKLRMPFESQFDFSLSQDFIYNLKRGGKITLMWTVMNVANLLNKDWGICVRASDRYGRDRGQEDRKWRREGSRLRSHLLLLREHQVARRLLLALENAVRCSHHLLIAYRDLPKELSDDVGQLFLFAPSTIGVAISKRRTYICNGIRKSLQLP